MKQGICLGRPPARSNLLLAVMLVAAGAGGPGAGVLSQRARTEVEELANEVASLSRAFSRPVEGAESPLSPSPDRTRFITARLRLPLPPGAAGRGPPPPP